MKSQIHAGGRGKGILYDPKSREEIMKGGVKIAFSRERMLRNFQETFVGIFW